MGVAASVIEIDRIRSARSPNLITINIAGARNGPSLVHDRPARNIIHTVAPSCPQFPQFFESTHTQIIPKYIFDSAALVNTLRHFEILFISHLLQQGIFEAHLSHTV